MTQNTEPRLLEGRKQIISFTNLGSWRRVRVLIELGMPVNKLGGRWMAYTDRLDDWLRENVSG